MIKAILYDMDGTVLDTMPLYEHGWAVADEAFGFGGRIAALVPQIAGMNSRDSGEFVRAQIGEAFDYAAFRKIINDTLESDIAAQGIKCKKGAPEIFDTIRKMGIKQILATSSTPRHVLPYLKLAGIENAFDGMVTGDLVKKSKPDPEIFLLGAALAGCSPEECVVIEDAANGVRAGVAAGMKTIMIPQYTPIPDDLRTILWHECRDLSEIAGLVGEDAISAR